MNRGERRNRTAKIAKKRFRGLYCHYHGTPEAWFYRSYNERERTKAIGQCRDRRYSWRCRCEWCRGGTINKQSIAELNLYEGIIDAIDLNHDLNISVQNVRGNKTHGWYDWDHELWGMDVDPIPRSWNMSNRFHHT